MKYNSFTYAFYTSYAYKYNNFKHTFPMHTLTVAIIGMVTLNTSSKKVQKSVA